MNKLDLKQERIEIDISSMPMPRPKNIIPNPVGKFVMNSRILVCSIIMFRVIYILKFIVISS